MAAYDTEEWPCSRCTYLNEPGTSACEVCGGDRPPFDADAAAAQAAQAEAGDAEQEHDVVLASPSAAALGPITQALVQECTLHITHAAKNSMAPMGPPRVVESLHPLPQNLNFTIKHCFPGASYICVVFDPKCSMPGVPGAEQQLPPQDRVLPSRHGLRGMPAWLALAGKNGLMRCAGEPEHAGTSGRYVYGYHFANAQAEGGTLRNIVVESDTLAITASAQAAPGGTGNTQGGAWSEHWGWRMTLVPMAAVSWSTEHRVLHSYSFDFGLWLLRFLSSAGPGVAASGALHQPSVVGAAVKYLCTPGVPRKRQIVPLLAQLLSEPHLFLAAGTPPGVLMGRLGLRGAVRDIPRVALGELRRLRRESATANTDRVLHLVQLAALMLRAEEVFENARDNSLDARSADLSPPAPTLASDVRLAAAPLKVAPYAAPADSTKISAMFDTCNAFRHGAAVPSHVLCHAIAMASGQPASVLSAPRRSWPFSVEQEQAASLQMAQFQQEHDAEVVAWLRDSARSRDCTEIKLNVSALVMGRDAREKYPSLAAFSSGVLKLRAALIMILNHRLSHCIEFLDTQTDDGANATDAAASQNSQQAAGGAGVSPLALGSPLVPAALADQMVERLVSQLSASAENTRSGNTDSSSQWSLGSQVRSVSHLIFMSSKLPQLAEGVAAMTSPESARNTGDVLIHAGQARQSKDRGQTDPRSAKTIFTQLASKLRSMCNLPFPHPERTAMGHGMGARAEDVFGLEGGTPVSAARMARCLRPLRVPPHERKQNVFFVKFQDFNEQGRTVQTQGLDWGGLFRECLTLALSELSQPDTLTLFIPAENASARLGQGGTFVPNPALTSQRDLALFEMVGVLLGIVIRLKAPQDVPFSGIVWKLILGTAPDVADLEAADEPFVTSLRARLRTAATGGEAEVSELAAASTWEAISVDGTRVPLQAPPSAETPAGGVAPTRAALKAHAALLLGFRLRELEPAAAAMRRGLAGMLPMGVLRLFTPAEFAYLVQGEATIDVNRLAAHTVYAGEYNAQHRVVKRFWRIVRGFTEQQRVELVRFSWGRTRLPPPGQWPDNLKFKLGQWRRTGQDADGMLPIAATCSFALYLPAYSSDEIMRERLLLALAGTEYGTFDRA